MADSVFVSILGEYQSVITFFHVLGVIIGLGAATLTDILFFRFLKDFQISETEANTLNSISRYIWTAIGLIFLSGLGLYLPQMEDLNQSAKFLTKFLVVGVIIINGLILRYTVAPRLSTLSFKDDGSLADSNARSFRRRAFALGAISGVSWYSALALGLLDKSPFSFLILLLIYVLLLVSAVIGSQITERILTRRANNSTL